ncbi:hypothetical protein BOX15_Mlig030504g1 [Macrostomum lignano]|uniref:BTB domain-containing protein n=1 Tax=Macrostomum lignano TaxID=282301 RepID=A0A267G4G0_9PLAT|nr:hypothetical protein BOX15_Mlig030504g1 [Macrostomum lignano]
MRVRKLLAGRRAGKKVAKMAGNGSSYDRAAVGDRSTSKAPPPLPLPPPQYQLQHQQHRKLPVPPAQSQLQQQRMRQYLDLQKQYILNQQKQRQQQQGQKNLPHRSSKKQDLEKRKQENLQKQQQEDLQKQQQEDLQKKRQEDLQKQQQEDLQKQQQEDLQKQQQEDLQKQQQEDLQKQQEDLQKQKQEDLQKQQQEDLQKHQEDLQKQKQADLQKQQQQDLQKQQQEDLQKQQQEDLQKHQQEDLQKQQQKDLQKHQEDLQKQQQEDPQKQQQEDLQKQQEDLQKQQEDLQKHQEDLQKQKQADLQKQQQQDLQKQQQEDLQKQQQEDLQKQKQADLQKQQQQDLQKKQQEDLQKQQQEDLQKHQQEDLQKQQQKDLQKQQQEDLQKQQQEDLQNQQEDLQKKQQEDLQNKQEDLQKQQQKDEEQKQQQSQQSHQQEQNNQQEQQQKHSYQPIQNQRHQLNEQQHMQQWHLWARDKADATQSYDGQIQPQQQQAPRDLTLYSLKFGINVPYSDVRRLVQTGARLLYSLKECSRAGRVNWKLRMRRCDSPDSNRSQPPSGRASDPYVSLYLKFEPQTLAESASCSVEFAVRLAGPSGRSVERRSAGRRQFDQRDSCRGWARFARASELEALAFSINGVKHLKLSGVLQVFDASQFLYPERRHNFARCQMGADFRLRVQLATFHVHRAVLALNSDYFAALLARPDSLESRQGQVVLSEDRIQDVHLMLQFMYPGYADVLDDETLKPLSRLAAKYQVHSLAWSCMQYIDSKLGEHPAPDAERISLYYFVCQESLQCPDLAEQCVRIAASLPWRGGLREARHFRELDETRKSRLHSRKQYWCQLFVSIKFPRE